MSSQAEFRQARRAHWDGVARRMDHWRGWGGPYQRRLAEVYRFAVPPGLKVLELGCGTGELLAALKPALGIGADLSLEMLRRAKVRHPELHYLQGDAQTLRLHQRFDVIVLSDLVNDLWDAQTVLENLAGMVHSRSRVILNSYSRLWELPLSLAQRLGLAKPSLQQNWFTTDDLAGLLQLAGSLAAAQDPMAGRFGQSGLGPILAVPPSGADQLHNRPPAALQAVRDPAHRECDRPGPQRGRQHPTHLPIGTCQPARL